MPLVRGVGLLLYFLLILPYLVVDPWALSVTFLSMELAKDLYPAVLAFDPIL